MHSATGNRESCSSCGAGEKETRLLDWPFRYPSFLYMSVLAGPWFRDVLLLQDQSEWFFRTLAFLRKPKGSGVGFECAVIVALLFETRQIA